MNREELPQEASREDKMRDALKHYEELATKACWHRSDIPDAIRAYYASLPPAEGAEAILKKENKKCVCGAELKHRGGFEFWCDNPHCKTAYVLDADGHISESGTVGRKVEQQPTAEGAEEILRNILAEIWWGDPVPADVFENPDYKITFLDAKTIAEKFATLHAQRIADKMVEKISPTNEQIHAAALAWARDHSEAPDKDCPDWLIRDYEAGAYFVRQCYGCWNKTDKTVSERCKKCKYRGLPDSINEALNSGDGVYRP